MSLYEEFQKEKKILQHPQKLDASNVGTPSQKSSGGAFVKSYSADESKDEKEKKDIIESQKEKGQKDIAEGLSKLKSNDVNNRVTLESMMPSRNGEKEGDGHERIKIPTSSSFHSQSLVYEKEKIEAAKKTLQEQNKGLVKGSVFEKEKNENPLTDIFEKPISEKITSTKQEKKEETIFSDENTGLSRKELEHDFRKDPKIWQAAKQSGLTMSPTERSELVKEVFSQAYGTNISKTDLKWGIKKLNQKLLDTKDQAQHAKIRKEINFFKKIGGL